MSPDDTPTVDPKVNAVSSGLDGPIRTADVLELLDTVARVDGVAAVSEQGILALQHRREAVRHLWIAPGGMLTAYAQVDETGSAELCVHPAHRLKGMGRQLVEKLMATTSPLAIWAHGNLPGARALARATGLVVTRELLQMSYELPTAAIREHPTPEGVEVRTFQQGEDEAAWVELNALAFADHPEQGRLTVDDMAQRQTTDWFDPSLIWLAHRPDEPDTLLASMWVKIPPGSTDGEIYVLAVHPAAQGEGLGGWLTTVALREMQRRGMRTASLYVDGDNTPALRTYRRAGFEQSKIDVQYSPPTQDVTHP